MASTTIEQALYTYLLGQSSLTDLIDQRLYYVDVEENEAMPYIEYRTVSPENDAWAFGEIRARRPLIQFNTVTTDKYIGLQIANVLHDLLINYSGDMDGIQIEIPIEGRGPREYRIDDFDDRITFVTEYEIQCLY